MSDVEFQGGPGLIPCCPHCVHEPGFVHKMPCLMPDEHDSLRPAETI